MSEDNKHCTKSYLEQMGGRELRLCTDDANCIIEIYFSELSSLRAFYFNILINPEIYFIKSHFDPKHLLTYLTIARVYFALKI